MRRTAQRTPNTVTHLRARCSSAYRNSFAKILAIVSPNTIRPLIIKEIRVPSSLEKTFVRSHLAGRCSNLCSASYGLLIVDEA
jgi:hypothetical protein